jgi:hypothetical protein
LSAGVGVAEFLTQLKALAQAGQRLLVAALPLVDGAEVIQAERLA